ncbi:MAG: carbonic anhydrase [Phycisphaerales bacterium]
MRTPPSRRLAAVILVLGAICTLGLTVQHHQPAHQPGHDSHAPKAAQPHATPGEKRPTATQPGKSEAKPVKPAAKTSEKAADRSERSEARPAASDEPVDADGALRLLREGNARWVDGSPQHPRTETSRRQVLAEQGQKPFVTVLTCADSRLPVERLFDRGVGEVFVVRVAGNIAGNSEVGTIEYGVGHLNTPLLVVMGHTRCGAVAAAASGAEVHGKVAGLVAAIAPAVERARRQNPEADESRIAALAVKENVWQAVYDLLRSSPSTRELVESGRVRVVGAVCDIATGKVDWMGEHPWQAELLGALAAAALADGAHTDRHAVAGDGEDHR